MGHAFLLIRRGCISGIHSAALRQKKLQNLRSAASQNKILRLRHHQDSQVAIYDNPKLWTSKVHCVKSVQIRSFFWSVFSRIRTEYGEILRIWTLRIWTPYSVYTDILWTLRIWTKNSVFGHFSRSAYFAESFVQKSGDSTPSTLLSIKPSSFKNTFCHWVNQKKTACIQNWHDFLYHKLILFSENNYKKRAQVFLFLSKSFVSLA